MPLPQTLKPNQRGTPLYKNSVFQGYENIYVPTEEQLYQEQIDHEMNEIHDTAILALKNWSSLTAKKKDAILKGLVKWALYKDERLKLGVL